MQIKIQQTLQIQWHLCDYYVPSPCRTCVGHDNGQKGFGRQYFMPWYMHFCLKKWWRVICFKVMVIILLRCSEKFPFERSVLYKTFLFLLWFCESTDRQLQDISRKRAILLQLGLVCRKPNTSLLSWLSPLIQGSLPKICVQLGTTAHKRCFFHHYISLYFKYWLVPLIFYW